MKINGFIIIALIIIVIIFGFTAYQTFNLGLEYTEMTATAGLLFAVVAFAISFFTFFATYYQLQKTMAKPKIKVAFNKSGKQHTTVIYKDGKLTAGLPSLWLINKGNAVARYFQIDFIIPESIGKQSVYKSITREDGNYIFSYTNDGKYTLFVNRPFQDPNINTAINTKACID